MYFIMCDCLCYLEYFAVSVRLTLYSGSAALKCWPLRFGILINVKIVPICIAFSLNPWFLGLNILLKRNGFSNFRINLNFYPLAHRSSTHLAVFATCTHSSREIQLKQPSHPQYHFLSGQHSFVSATVPYAQVSVSTILLKFSGQNSSFLWSGDQRYYIHQICNKKPFNHNTHETRPPLNHVPTHVPIQF